jgi:hypothetical protein
MERISSKHWNIRVISGSKFSNPWKKIIPDIASPLRSVAVAIEPASLDCVSDGKRSSDLCRPWLGVAFGEDG